MTTRPTPLVLAKAPVPGEVKTRLGADVGLDQAADLAAAALLDTLDVVRAAFPRTRGVVAMAGDLDRAARSDDLRAALADFAVVPQRGDGFGERLANAHAVVGGPTVQIGMDTPHLTADDLAAVGAALGPEHHADHDAVIGGAEDGGWWVLALRDPAHARVLADVPMSRPDTGDLTRAALLAVPGLRLAEAATAYDVDTVVEAARAADDAPDTRFAAAWRALQMEVTR